MKISRMRHLLGVTVALLWMVFAPEALAQVLPCPYPDWNSGTVYVGGNRVKHLNKAYEARWWTQNENPALSGQWGVWRYLHDCSSGENIPPTANAGADSIAVEGSVVSLSGSGTDTDGTITAYLWAQTAGPAVTLSAANTANASFSAPQVSADTPLTFQLTVTDNQGATGSDLVVVTVRDATVIGHERCRPDGLYKTPGADVPYCSIYDNNGREQLANGTARRVIGYFTAWRHGKNGQPAYLAKDIPWTRITHINYAFAHVGADNRISVGNEASPTNPATGMTWPGVSGAEMDAAYSYQGHFNLLNRYKKLHPNVRTLISVGGWAETGGYFDDNGQRVASGGFYTMTTLANGAVNTAGINAFADSAVAFIRRYGFDGVDIDYEYPASTTDAGNPDDFTIANARRGGLNASYNVLIKTLRERLDAAGVQDGRHYLLTSAVPASGYLLRGLENYKSLQYFDYVNVMSYDLHGAWNEFVGPNAALFDDGRDSELVRWNVYGTAQYGGIGYLNTDWAYHYYRGALSAGRVNMGVPYYTRGFRNVTGGTNGLWGRSVGAPPCPPGTTACGDGAVGIDNLWHDVDAQGRQVGGGSNPMWHAMNLQNGIVGSYGAAYGLDPVNDPTDRLTGTYTRYYDATLVAPWLWNAQKRVFLSTEDEQSIAAKAQWIVDRGIGGAMIWELAGDYDRRPNGEYFMGSTLTRLLHTTFASAPAYGNRRANRVMPAQAMNVEIALSGYLRGEQNYPISPTLTITNRTAVSLPGGTEFQFDVPTSTPANFSDQSGFSTSVLEVGHSGNNIGGLDGDFHRASIRLPGWQSLAPGASVTLTFVHYLPISGPGNFTVTYNGTRYALKFEYPSLPVAY
jgi:GH18 family chitinase/chitodextrinase